MLGDSDQKIIGPRLGVWAMETKKEPVFLGRIDFFNQLSIEVKRKNGAAQMAQRRLQPRA